MIKAVAEELVRDRVNLIGDLAKIMEDRAKVQERLEELEKQYAAAYSKAGAGGWTESELRRLGAEAPVKRPVGRPRKSTPRTGS